MVRAARDVQVDTWEPCTGGRSIDDFIRNIALPRCPSFQICHNRWMALGAPDLDTSHWPYLPEMQGLMPRNFHELLSIMHVHSDLFVHRAARYWMGDPLPDLTLPQIAPFVVIELTISADLEVQEKMTRMPMTNREQLFAWCRSVNHRLTAMSHFVRQCIDSCIRPNGPHNCLLRICFGELYCANFQAKVFADWFRRTQLINPSFGAFAMDAAHAESPTQWIIPDIAAFNQWLRGAQPHSQPFHQAQYPTYIAEVVEEVKPVTKRHKAVTKTEVLNSPARIDLFKLLCGPNDGATSSASAGDAWRFSEVIDGVSDATQTDSRAPPASSQSPLRIVNQMTPHSGLHLEAQSPNQHHSCSTGSASTSTLAAHDRRHHLGGEVQYPPRRPDTWASSLPGLEPTHRRASARDLAWGHRLHSPPSVDQEQRHKPDAFFLRSSSSSGQLPRPAGNPAELSAHGTRGASLFTPSRQLYDDDGRFHSRLVQQPREWHSNHLAKPQSPESPAGANRRHEAVPRSYSPPTFDARSKAKRRRSQDLVGHVDAGDPFAEAGNGESEGRSESKTPADRAQQSREKMRRYAARVKRQREALTTMCEDLDHQLGPVGSATSNRSAYNPSDVTPEPGSPGTVSGFGSPTAASKLEFASASEKLNYQKRASKARKRSSEQEQMERLSLLAESFFAAFDRYLAIPSFGCVSTQKPGSESYAEPSHLGPHGKAPAVRSSEERRIAHIVEATFRRHTDLWDDLVEAEKRLRGTGRGGSGGSAPAAHGSDGPIEAAEEAHAAKRPKQMPSDLSSTQAGPSRNRSANPKTRWVQRLVQCLTATAIGGAAFSR